MNAPRLWIGLIAALGCLAQPCWAAETRTEIEAANAAFSDAATKGDSAAIAALYTTNAQVMPAGSEPVRGRDAIQKFWQGALNSGIAAVSLKTLEVFGHGTTVTEVGHYELRDKTGKTLDIGKYIVIWQHEQGQWKLLRDMFSTNLPPPKS
jgi:ketosteroid isomerase-like protein